MTKQKGAFIFATILIVVVYIALPSCVSETGDTEKSEAKLPAETSAPKKATPPPIATKPSDEPVSKKTSQTIKKKDFRVLEDDSYASIRSGGFFTTTSIEGLTPEAATAIFNPGQKVYAYAGIHAPRKETVGMTWIGNDGKEILPSAYLDVEPNTGEVGYRVFTYRIFRTPGNYKVVLANSVGEIIGETKFQVVKTN